MSVMKSANPDFEAAVRAAFERQPFMSFLGAQLGRVEPGRVEIRLPFHEGVGQNHGYFHGGVIGAMADVAGGFSAFSLLPPNSSVLTAEYKLSILAPGLGEELVSRGEILRAGKTLLTAEVKIHVVREGQEHLCAVALQTLRGRTGGAEVQF